METGLAFSAEENDRDAHNTMKLNLDLETGQSWDNHATIKMRPENTRLSATCLVLPIVGGTKYILMAKSNPSVSNEHNIKIS